MVVTLEDCKKIIYRYSKGTEDVVGYSINPLSETPMGFLGDHFKLNIKTTKKDDKSKIQSVNFFLKTLPQGNDDHLAYVKQLGVFKKEALLYKNVLTDFQKLHRNPILPKCYLVNPDSFIVLQDLCTTGYDNCDDELDIDHWISLIQTMAHFHASTIIFEESRHTDKPYRIIDFHKDELKEATFISTDGHPRQRWSKTTSKAIADSMKLFPDIKNAKQCGEKLTKIVSTEIFDYTTPSTKYRNVITHADLWKNNAMFKQRARNDINCLLIDFQLARYVPAAFDILTTLYVNSTEEFLNKNAEVLLEVYYQTFCGCLKTHNIDPEEIMSRTDYMASIEHYKLPALIEATMFATIIFVSPELSTEMLNDENVFNEFTYTNRSKYVKQEILENPHFKERYGNILKQLCASLNS